MVEALENIQVNYQPITWCEDNLVMYNEGQAWTSVIIDGQPEHVHLGQEVDVKVIISGNMPISDTCSYKRYQALKRIIQLKEEINGRQVGGDSLERCNTNGTSRSRQKDPNFSKARKKITNNKAYHKTKSLSR